MNRRPAAPDVYDEALARHYDQDYEILRRDIGDVRFYRELARASGGPVLDVGCGTGRVLLPIARDGLQITGVDASPTMLAQLERKLPGEPEGVRARVRVLPGRIGALPTDGPYALVVAAFRTFQHVHGRPAQVAALRELARVLAPHGLLAFDVFDDSPQRGAPADGERCDYRLEQGGHVRQRLSQARRAADGRSLEGRFRWMLDGVELERATFRLEILRRAELEPLLGEAGLVLEALYGDFDGSEWCADDPRELVVLARRAATTSGSRP